MSKSKTYNELKSYSEFDDAHFASGLVADEKLDSSLDDKLFLVSLAAENWLYR